MSTDKTVQIEVDGRQLEARAGQMVIEVTDAHGIYVPRFCYHKQLSVAANCRMCLVEVEKAPKPLPACATPVMDGMKVATRSELAREAQKSVMEFLLINHPLDCPICDQGGECELQDLAMGYGAGVSRYQESKRVVKDKNIGPLIHTDMTRCIHCTRCVRFGEEIAGLRELGVTGRGEQMQIGTYVEKSVSSELSGNLIDVCPVGALTSKPFRYLARAWEMVQHPGIAPHDSVGSNVQLHVKGERVMRVVPAENAAVNDVWLSDRDRFSYEGLYSEDRLQLPMIKKDGVWETVDWQTAFAFASAGLREVLATSGAGQLGGLAMPSATLEELYLLQKLLRGLGCHNIDHRLRQKDFRQQEADPIFPFLGQDIAALETLDAALLIGSYVRQEQPMINYRLRKAALQGGNVMLVNSVDYDFNYAVAERIIVAPPQLPVVLAAILKALFEMVDTPADEALKPLLAKVQAEESHRAVANKLLAAEQGLVLLGNLAVAHEQFATLKVLAAAIAKLAQMRFGFLSEAANSSGACLAGVLPHRGPAGQAVDAGGLDVEAMLQEPLQAYVLLGIEPEFDCWDGGQALAAMQSAKFVVSMTAYESETMREYADVLLPRALFAEISGTYVNVAGQVQVFTNAVPPMAESRPAWKILRVLADRLEVDGCAYDSWEAIRDEVHGLIDSVIATSMATNMGSWSAAGLSLDEAADDSGLHRITALPMYAVDAMVRRSPALQQVGEPPVATAQINLTLANKLQLADGEQVVVEQGDYEWMMPLLINDAVADDCVLLPQAASVATSSVENERYDSQASQQNADQVVNQDGVATQDFRDDPNHFPEIADYINDPDLPEMSGILADDLDLLGGEKGLSDLFKKNPSAIFDIPEGSRDYEQFLPNREVSSLTFEQEVKNGARQSIKARNLADGSKVVADFLDKDYVVTVKKGNDGSFEMIRDDDGQSLGTIDPKNADRGVRFFSIADGDISQETVEQDSYSNEISRLKTNLEENPTPDSAGSWHGSVRLRKA